ncbi:MAG: nucleotidyl transferase AbiEii/AbiGii toxin family protein [Candidatus Njordarchaeia archaeon]
MVLPVDELKRYAFKRRLKRLDQIRKDYIQDVILFILFTQINERFVFKGGTCLWKIYKSNRFSEDLDLEINKQFDFVQNLADYLEAWGLNVDVGKKRLTTNALYARLDISHKSLGRERVAIEVVFKESKDVKNVLYTSPYPDIPNFPINVLSIKKIIADKISAIINRNQPRDLYDLYFLLTTYDQVIEVENEREFKNCVLRKKEDWKELQYLVIGRLPKFEDVTRAIFSRISSG